MDPIDAYQRHYAVLKNEPAARIAAAGEISAHLGREVDPALIRTRHPSGADVINAGRAEFRIRLDFNIYAVERSRQISGPCAFLRIGYTDADARALIGTRFSAAPTRLQCSEFGDRDAWVAEVVAWAAQFGPLELRISEPLNRALTEQQLSRLAAITGTLC